MVREQHRLGMLQVRVARQDDVEVRFGLGDERLAQGDVGGHELAGAGDLEGGGLDGLGHGGDIGLLG